MLLPVSSKIGSKKEKVTTKKLGTFLYQVFYMIYFYFAAKSTVSGQIIAYYCKSILTIPSENVHAAHVSPDRNYLAQDIGWKQPIPSLGELS